MYRYIKLKDKIINSIIKVVVNVFSIWVVFSASVTWITTTFSYLGITDPKAIISAIAVLGTGLTESIILLIEFLRFRFINPINLKVDFIDDSDNIMQSLKIELPNEEVKKSNLTAKYSIQMSIDGGNLITNNLLNILGGDVRITYNSDAYDSEMTEGWAISSNGSLYKDKKGDLRYYWTDSVKGFSKIEPDDSIIYKNKIIIKPKRYDIHKCLVNVKICSSTRKNILQKLGFFFLKKNLIKCEIKSFHIILE